MSEIKHWIVTACSNEIIGNNSDHIFIQRIKGTFEQVVEHLLELMFLDKEELMVNENYEWECGTFDKKDLYICADHSYISGHADYVKEHTLTHFHYHVQQEENIDFMDLT